MTYLRTIFYDYVSLQIIANAIDEKSIEEIDLKAESGSRSTWR